MKTCCLALTICSGDTFWNLTRRGLWNSVILTCISGAKFSFCFCIFRWHYSLSKVQHKDCCWPSEMQQRQSHFLVKSPPPPKGMTQCAAPWRWAMTSCNYVLDDQKGHLNMTSMRLWQCKITIQSLYSFSLQQFWETGDSHFVLVGTEV